MMMSAKLLIVGYESTAPFDSFMPNIQLKGERVCAKMALD